MLKLKKKTIGFIVDEVTEVLRIPRDVIEAPPDLVSAQKSEFITGVGKLEDRLLILLDLDKIISSEESSALADIN